MYFSKTPDCLASSAAAGKFQGEKGEAVGKEEGGREEDIDGWGGGGRQDDCASEGEILMPPFKQS